MREGWEQSELSNIAEVVMGQSPPGASYNSVGSGMPFIQGSAEFGAIHPSPVKWCTDPRKIAEPGDVLFSVRAPVGDLNVANQRIAIGRGLSIIRGTDDKASTSFLALALSFGASEIAKRSSTGMFTSITGAQLKSLPIALPPLDEQRRIVDLMDSVDAAISAAQDEVDAAVEIMDRFRDLEIWETEERTLLSELCMVDGKLVDPVGVHSEMIHVGTNRIAGGTGDIVGAISARAEGITSGKYPFDSRHVIYSKIRPNLRKVARPNFAGLCSADAYPLLPNEGVTRIYLQQLLLSSQFTDAVVSRSSRTKMPKVNRTELMCIEVPARSVEEINEMSVTLSEMDAVRIFSQEALDRLRDLRSSMLSVLLSGEHEIPATYDQFLGLSDDERAG